MRIALPLDLNDDSAVIVDQAVNLSSAILDSEPSVLKLSPSKIAFVKLYERIGNVTECCKQIGIKLRQFNSWIENDEEFREHFAEAEQAFGDAIKGVVVDRAVNGLGKRKKFTRDGTPIQDPETGQQYFEVIYDTNLMLATAKAYAPDRFGDKVQHNIEGTIKAYVCFDPAQIGSVNSSEDLQNLPTRRERSESPPVDRH